MCLPIAPIASVFDDLPASADMSIPSMSWAPTMVATASRMAQVVTNDAAFMFGFIALLRGWVGVPIIIISKLVREKHTNSERSPLLAIRRFLPMLEGHPPARRLLCPTGWRGVCAAGAARNL